jgi:hypothetical protein
VSQTLTARSQIAAFACQALSPVYISLQLQHGCRRTLASLAATTIHINDYCYELNDLSLQAWIAVFGASQLILSQLPDISSLREINLVCTLCTVCFAIGCAAMSIYNGALPPSAFP